MKGYLHIFRTGIREGPHELRTPQYQINYTVAGRTYARILEEPELMNFFREGIAMDSALMTQAVEQLRATGQTTIGDLELTENDAYELELLESSSDV